MDRDSCSASERQLAVEAATGVQPLRRVSEDPDCRIRRRNRASQPKGSAPLVVVLNAVIVAATETDAFRPAANSRWRSVVSTRRLRGGPRLANPSSVIAVGFVGEAAL